MTEKISGAIASIINNGRVYSIITTQGSGIEIPLSASVSRKGIRAGMLMEIDYSKFPQTGEVEVAFFDAGELKTSLQFSAL